MRVALDEQEVLALLKVARASSQRDHCLLLMAYRHGLRVSEVASIRLGDIADGHLTVHRLKGSLRTVQPIVPHPGQPLLDEAKALREWLKVRPNDGSDYVFVSQKGGRLDRSAIFRKYQQYATEAGLPAEKRHPHSLKHSIASRLIARQVPVVEVKQFLGHKSLSSTMQYVEVDETAVCQHVQAVMMMS
jgi:site-specific recombinase XerD